MGHHVHVGVARFRLRLRFRLRSARAHTRTHSATARRIHTVRDGVRRRRTRGSQLTLGRRGTRESTSGGHAMAQQQQQPQPLGDASGAQPVHKKSKNRKRRRAAGAATAADGATSMQVRAVLMAPGSRGPTTQRQTHSVRAHRRVVTLEWSISILFQQE